MVGKCVNNSNVLALCRFNLRLYFYQLHHLLLRYKITVIFALLLLSPSISAVLSFLTYPFVEYFNFATFTSMFLLQCVAVVAALIYRNVLNVREWENYLKSLPVSKTEKITADILSLLLMNAFISVLILYAGIHTHANLLQIMLLIAVFITTQLSVIYKKYINTLLISMIFFCLLLVKDAHQISMLILYYATASFLLYTISYRTYLSKNSTANHAARTLLSYKQQLAYVPASSSFFPTVNGSEFLSFIQAVKGRNFTSEVLKNTYAGYQLENYLTTQFENMSVGTKKKFFLSTFGIQHHAIVLLDEPTNALDESAKSFLKNEIIKI